MLSYFDAKDKMWCNQLLGKVAPIHQSGGCCDDSQPMGFAREDFRVGSSDRCLGEVHHCNFYMSADQFEYWIHTQLILNVTPGKGSSFSLDLPLSARFFIEFKLFTEDELENPNPLIATEEN